MNKPLISIIIPIYNQGEYLDDCLKSVINQTYQNIEIICINDGSTDDSWSIIQKYKNKDHRIVAINQKNQGVYSSRCNGVRIAKGEYISFLDSDDILDICFIEKLYSYIISDKVKIVRCNFKKIKSGKYINNNTNLECGLFFKNEFENKIYNNIVSSFDLNSVCMQLVDSTIAKEAIKKKYKLGYGEDLIFNCSLLNKVDSIRIIDDCLYYYRSNDKSYSKNNSLDSVYSKVNDILNYTNLIDCFSDEWIIKNKVLFKRRLCYMLLKNLLYQLVYIENIDEMRKCLKYIYSNSIYIRITSNNPYTDYGIKNSIMLCLARSILLKRERLLLFQLKLFKKYLV